MKVLLAKDPADRPDADAALELDWLTVLPVQTNSLTLTDAGRGGGRKTCPSTKKSGTNALSARQSVISKFFL